MPATLATRRRSLPLDSMLVGSSPRGSLQALKRFDGQRKAVSSWDGLRRDPEFCFDGAGCSVYFHSRAASRRSSSLKVPLRCLQQMHASYLTENCLHKQEVSSQSASPTASEDDSSDSGYGASICSDGAANGQYQLFIPAPADVPQEGTLAYHVTTRNYFAYLLGKPLVGRRLYSSLIELWQRIQTWQMRPSSSDFIDYCQSQGYMDFANSPQYALAMLAFASEARLRDTWIDAFVHCVGMRDRLGSSSELEGLNHTTRALIARAALELDLLVPRVTRALGSFLEDELGAECLGLSKPARDHLDRFRSCLHSFYVEKEGYFPPDPNDAWDKRLWHGMYHDFESVYEYLADKESSSERPSSRFQNGGVCVEQNVEAFNERHGYSPLPHPLPLLPEQLSGKRASETQKALMALKLGRSDSSTEMKALLKQALAQASNSSSEVMTNGLVQEYVRFERAPLLEKVSAAEARKVRWLLVYSALQMLSSIVRAPDEVRDTETPLYPLCVGISACPSPEPATPLESEPETPARLSAEMENVRRTMESDRISIHPDCEADNAGDFFAKTSLSRSASDLEFMVQPALQTSTPVNRTASIRSSVTSLHRSVVGSLSRRNSLRRGSLTFAPRKMSSFRNDRVAEPSTPVGDDNYVDSPSQMLPKQLTPTATAFDQIDEEVIESSPRPLALTCVQDEEESEEETNSEPTLHGGQLGAAEGDEEDIATDHYEHEHDHEDLYALSTLPSRLNPIPTLVDYASSSDDDESPRELELAHDQQEQEWQRRKENNRRLSALDFGFAFDEAWSEPATAYTSIPEETAHDLDIAAVADRSRSDIHQDALDQLSGASPITEKPTSLNVGTYRPTGLTEEDRNPALPSRVFHLREISSESVSSMASSNSSVYPETSQQAAEIVEEEVRGRRRSRALDRLPGFGAMKARFASQAKA